MGSSFSVDLQATFNTESVASQIRNLGNERIQLHNFDVNATSVVSQVQAALDGANFRININDVNLGNMNRQLQNVGQNIGQNLGNNVNRALNRFRYNFNTNNLNNAFTDFGLDQRAIDNVTRDLQQLDIAISDIQHAYNTGRNTIDITVQGEDSLGRALTITKQYEAQSGNLINTIERVRTSFGDMQQTITAASDAMNNGSLDKGLTQAIAKLNSLSSTRNPLLTNVQEDLQSAISIYTQMGSQQGEALANSYREVVDLLSSAQNRLSSIQAMAKQDNIAQNIRANFENSAIDLNIAKVMEQYRKLSANGGTRLSTAKEDIDSLASLREGLSSALASGDSAQIIASYEQLDTVLTRIKNNLSIVAAENKNLVSSLDVSKVKNDLTNWMEKNSKASKEYGSAVRDIIAELDNLDISAEDASGKLEKIKQNILGIKQGAAAKGLTGRSFLDTFSSAFSSIGRYVSASTIFYEAIKMSKQMYQNVLAIDTAMTNLYKVTDETDQRYDDFLNSSADSAKNLGRTISSYINQTAEWTKLGYTLDQSEELSKLSSIYANVAEVDDSKAVSDMVTAMKAFNIEATNAQTIIDPLNELGNKFATSAGDLGDGLSKAASSLANAGTDMYKTLAMLTGGAEITQNAGEFGNFLKIASMRIRGMKGELEALGEEVDSNVDSISKVQTQILNLTHGKVNIFDNMGEFRDYYDIMEDIAEVYDTLTSTEQAELSEILFGKMRGNQGAALIQAFQSGQVQNAYKTAVNSAGSAMAEQDKWMESLEAKTQRFKAAWEELSMTTMNSDFLKAAVDAGTGFLEVLNGIVDTIGVLTPLLAGGGIAAFFKNLD